MLPVLYSIHRYTHFDLLTKKKEKSKIEKDINDYEELKESLYSHMLELHAPAIEECESLKALYEDLKEDYARKREASQNNFTDSFLGFDSTDPFDLGEEEEVEVDSKLKKICKKLFKKIANVCHPDKVGSAGLANFFKMALDAYSSYDVKELERIWSLVKDKKKRGEYLKELGLADDSNLGDIEDTESTVMSLDDQILMLESEISELLATVELFENDEFHFVIVMYKQHGMNVAEAFHENLLKESIAFHQKKVKEFKRKIAVFDDNDAFDFS